MCMSIFPNIPRYLSLSLSQSCGWKDDQLAKTPDLWAPMKASVAPSSFPDCIQDQLTQGVREFARHSLNAALADTRPPSVTEEGGVDVVQDYVNIRTRQLQLQTAATHATVVEGLRSVQPAAEALERIRQDNPAFANVFDAIDGVWCR